MKGLGIMLADLTAYEVQDMRKPWTSSAIPYFLMMFGILIGVSLVGCLFIIAIRRRGKRRHRRHHHESHADSRVRPPAPVKKHRRRRRRSGTERPLNPTLAETGGLPPVRDANTPPPGL